MSNTSHPLSYKALEPMSWCQISNIIHHSAKEKKTSYLILFVMLISINIYLLFSLRCALTLVTKIPKIIRKKVIIAD